MRAVVFVKACLCFLTLLFARQVSAAAELVFSPSDLVLRPEQEAVVSLSLQSGGLAVYTAGLGFNYDAALLDVQGFSFAPTWLPLRQDQYDWQNKTAGLLFKTAGYPSGFNGVQLFGYLRVKAKRAGHGRLSLTATSFVMSEDNRQQSITGADLRFLIAAQPAIQPPGLAERPVVSSTLPEADYPSFSLGSDYLAIKAGETLQTQALVGDSQRLPATLKFVYYRQDGSIFRRQQFSAVGQGRHIDAVPALPAGVYGLVATIGGSDWSMSRSQTIVVRPIEQLVVDNWFWLAFVLGLLLFLLGLWLSSRRRRLAS